MADMAIELNSIKTNTMESNLGTNIVGTTNTLGTNSRRPSTMGTTNTLRTNTMRNKIEQIFGVSRGLRNKQTNKQTVENK